MKKNNRENGNNIKEKMMVHKKAIAAAVTAFGILVNGMPAMEVHAASPGVSYQTHIQEYGWQEWKQDGEISGTSGESKRLEGIRIELPNQSYQGDIEYRTHVEEYGWQDFVKNGEMAGTSGESKRLEGIQIRLTGEMANRYDVYYRVHAQTFGWLDWAKNGESAGTAGYSYRLEGIQVKLVSKNGQAPGNTGSPFRQPDLQYKTHVQGDGWQNFVSDGQMSGTSGESKRLEGIQIRLNNQNYQGDIEYRTHVEEYGWQNFVKNGEMAGTSGESKRLEAIQMRLTGEMANHYDVYYRVHAQTFGWLDWAKNGESAGTAGYSYRLEGIEIQLVQKGGRAPGNTYLPFKEKPTQEPELTERAICNACGEDITNIDIGEHLYNHMINGENGSWHSEWR